MVRTQIESRGVTDAAVLDAMRTVPRERFVPEDAAESAHKDGPLPIGHGQTISQPYIVALMIEALGVGAGDRVLEVGAGSGYAAAVLGRIASEVYAIERHAELTERARRRMESLGYANIHIRSGDGTRGWDEHAPYDAILVSAGGRDTPRSLLEQLAIGGTLVIPVGDRPHGQELVRITRTTEHGYDEDMLGRVRFVPLVQDASG